MYLFRQNINSMADIKIISQTCGRTVISLGDSKGRSVRLCFSGDSDYKTEDAVHIRAYGSVEKCLSEFCEAVCCEQTDDNISGFFDMEHEYLMIVGEFPQYPCRDITQALLYLIADNDIMTSAVKRLADAFENSLPYDTPVQITAGYTGRAGSSIRTISVLKRHRRQSNVNLSLDINGRTVRSMEDMRAVYSDEIIMKCFESGHLILWLRDRGYDEAAEQIQKLSGIKIKEGQLAVLRRLFAPKNYNANTDSLWCDIIGKQTGYKNDNYITEEGGSYE